MLILDLFYPVCQMSKYKPRCNYNSNNKKIHKSRVIARFGLKLIIDMPNITYIHIKKQFKNVICGDYILWEEINNNKGMMIELLPRKTTVKRITNGTSKFIAANVTQLVIMVAPIPKAPLTIVDQCIILAIENGIKPIIVCNKIDLIIPENNIKEYLSIYSNLGYPVYFISSYKKKNLSSLQAALLDNSNLLIGQSGVGKSTLIKTLIPGFSIKTKQLSEKTKQGMHTTTTSILYPLSNKAGDIIDSPGICKFSLSCKSIKELANNFIEVKELNKQCQFRNCTHIQEKGCAIIAGLTHGTISQERYNSFVKLSQLIL